MCFNSGGGSSSTTNTTSSYQLNDNSAGDVSGSKLSATLAGSNNNEINIQNTLTDSGAISAGKELGLAAIESGNQSVMTSAETFKTFASSLASSSDKSIDAVRLASASQSQQGAETFNKLFTVLALAGVAGVFVLKK